MESKTEMRVRIASIVAGPRDPDPLVKSCYDLLMASTWSARYGTKAERWEHARRMADESRALSKEFVRLEVGHV
jgi:hypothetical protein